MNRIWVLLVIGIDMIIRAAFGPREYAFHQHDERAVLFSTVFQKVSK
jgi:hypothetical protein